MLKVTKPQNDRIDIVLEGTLDADAMRQGLDDLIEMSKDMKHGKMLYTITSFSMPTAAAIGVEMTRLPQLFQLLGRIDRCAVLTDTSWLRTASEVEGALIPGMDIKGFALDQREAAEAWLEDSDSFDDVPV